MKRLLCIFILAALPAVAYLQPPLLTVAESSNFTSTSTHSEVMAYVERLQKTSKFLRVEKIATTTEGKDLPLLVIGNPVPKDPKDLHGRLVVYIQANIHAGEVEGKEASLMFARDLVAKRDPELLKHLVVLICPDLNADGNDRISKLNRTYQNGPANGVGERQNGQWLDLNRDAMKLESPEMRGVVANVLNRWDPAIIVDCHTTNGSYHQEPVTFTWMMNPNGDRELIRYMRDRMMPWVSQTLSGKYGTLNCFYGEFINQQNYEEGWISYASEPRYFSNYVGIRNRLGILNENYVYAGYRERVLGCYNLIASITDYALAYQTEIMQMLARADSISLAIGSQAASSDSFAVKYSGTPTPQKITILTYEAEAYTDEHGRERFRKTDTKRTVTVPYIADYIPVKSIAYPYAYILPVPDPNVLQLLRQHGVEFQMLTDSVTLTVEQFAIDSIAPDRRLNQGHYCNTINGSYQKVSRRFNKGDMVVKTSQKLGRLAAYLLEPQSDDGLVYWNFWDRYLVPQWGSYFFPVPVYRLTSPYRLPI
ncbi:MAG TPA: M14 family metallopeptidase [Tenuifilaceae bacterium]|nr:M14 family metallopeptidase [Tenuifilaceae bacterium]HQM05378.1 M14 family metallopeptidase [Tenuifilaceae bacterium]